MRNDSVSDLENIAKNNFAAISDWVGNRTNRVASQIALEHGFIKLEMLKETPEILESLCKVFSTYWKGSLSEVYILKNT